MSVLVVARWCWSGCAGCPGCAPMDTLVSYLPLVEYLPPWRGDGQAIGHRDTDIWSSGPGYSGQMHPRNTPSPPAHVQGQYVTWYTITATTPR